MREGRFRGRSHTATCFSMPCCIAIRSANPFQLACHGIHSKPLFPCSFVLVSDLDHTMVQNEDLTHEHLQGFNRWWCGGLGLSSALIYSTGRSPLLYRKLWVCASLAVLFVGGCCAAIKR